MKRQAVWILSAVWITSVVVGLAWLAAYDNAPGAAAEPPRRWPENARLSRDPERPTLLMLAHPRCDCTRASLGELAELMARAHVRPRAFVVFIRPAGVQGAWEQTSSWQTARQIAGVNVVIDDAGRLARQFGVQTSGQTLLYGSNGDLLFAGGTTGARGHRGDNAGRATILELLNGQQPTRTVSPVFGCDLFSPTVEHELPDAPEGSHGV